MSIQSLIIKPGIPSSPTDLDGFSRLIALCTLASVTGNKDTLFEEATSKEVMGLEGNLEAVLSYTDLK
jgi:hypothetical protein